MVSEVRLRLRHPAEEEARSVPDEMAPRRSIHQDEWSPTLFMASCRPARNGHRYSGATKTRSLGSLAFPSSAIARGGETTICHHHGQAAELCCGEKTDLA